MTLRVALVGGPMYDGLYQLLQKKRDDVEVVVHADHPSLNREVARRLDAGERIDVISTHSKYAPSQRPWLTPLDAALARGLAPRAVELCRFEGDLLSVPRNIDVRILWWRTDRMDAPPQTWEQLVASGSAFGFPGRESGLFGTFFELVVAAGGALFDGERPTMDGPEAIDAIEMLCRLAACAPRDLANWHYDQVDRALLEGRLDAAAAWPGGYGPIRSSNLAHLLAPAPYPAGSQRWASYAGCHSWAIPTTCADPAAAADLIAWLVSEEAACHDAGGGSIPSRVSALEGIEPADGTDRTRLEITLRTIEEAMITYPPLVRFPAVEDAGWQAIHDALVGRLTPAEAARAVQAAAAEALA